MVENPLVKGVSTTVLITVNPQQTIWDAILPKEVLGMPADLQRVDALLEDPAFFAPYRNHFSLFFGRPSIPIETYLRLMFLKFAYHLSYEVLCREVADSLSWRRFCRIPLGERVPHSTTLIKITGRCGEQTIAELNEILLAKAAGKKVVRLDKVRADSTVVEANVAYPTDAGLLAKAVGRINRLVGRIHEAGGARRTRIRNRSRSAAARVRAIASKLKLRGDEAKDKVKAINAELIDIATLSAKDAEAVVRNARRQLRSAGADASKALGALVDDLETTIARTRQIAEQTATRIAGGSVNGATRLVSLHDPDARPIVKGRLGKPVEFGYKVQVTDNTDGIVIDHSCHIGNPNDTGLLAPAIARIKTRFGKAPRDVAADRGYCDAGVETELDDMGVSDVVIPHRGKASPERREKEKSAKFRRLVKWRTGAEGRISVLKHSYSMNRSLMDGIGGAETWCGLGVLAHNSIKIARLIDEKAERDERRQTTRRRNREIQRAQATGPPDGSNKKRVA